MELFEIWYSESLYAEGFNFKHIFKLNKTFIAYIHTVSVKHIYIVCSQFDRF